jgi:hypothetical protein
MPEKKVEEKKPEVPAKTNVAPININATNKVQEKDDYDASEDYSEFEAEDLEDNTDARKNNNLPASNILANIPDLKTNDKDSDKL